MDIGLLAKTDGVEFVVEGCGDGTGFAFGSKNVFFAGVEVVDFADR